MKFEGKTVLITGSSRGIGKAIAVRCAKEGANLVINGTNQTRIDKTVNEIRMIGARAIGIKADVRDMKSVEHMIEVVRQEYGKINILVNNAAILEVKSIFDISEEKWVEIIDTNLNGVFRVTKAALRIMVNHEKYNKIINISSQAAKTGGILPVHHYAASKGGIITFTYSLARELAPYGILVNCVAPGVIRTEMVIDQIDEKNKIIPLGVGTVEDVANAVVFLASDESNYITGEVMDVNGGMFMD